jgi:SdrD B-like protein
MAADVQAPVKPASISGAADAASGAPLASTTVRLRSVSSGNVAATTTTNGTGEFAFSVAEPGNYVIEVVNAAGDVIGSSSMIAVTAGATIAGLTVRGPAAASTASAASKTSKPFFTSAAGIVTAAATAAAVVGVTVAANQGSASPSK